MTLRLSRTIFAAIAICALAVGVTLSSGSCSAQTTAPAAAQLEDIGPNPSTWRFDAAGHLLSVPGILEASYDAQGQLQHLTLYTAVKGGIRTTTYTWVPEYRPGRNAVKQHLVQTGDYPSEQDYPNEDAPFFELLPSFWQVKPDGTKVRVTTDEALKADPSTILGGIKIRDGFEHAMPFFLGKTYQAHINR